MKAKDANRLVRLILFERQNSRGLYRGRCLDVEQSCDESRLIYLIGLVFIVDDAFIAKGIAYY
ncbi:hypothetical protein TUM4444_27860 [Shewanella sp. MBTL60-112-B1]|nr:hypothetical protein TUM4444_27860 [Shewanella sp. MBTL60-112-B1]